MIAEKESVQVKEQEAKTVIINNQDDYKNAIEMIKGIKEYRKKLDDRYKPIQQKTKEANQLALKNINDYKIPLDEAERIIRSSMGRYAAKKEAERKVEEDRIKREAEEKEREAIKQDLEDCGLEEKEAVEESKKMDVVTPDVKLEDETKTEEVSYRINWKFKIVDITKIPSDYMIPDEKKIGQVVRALKDSANIPGIKIYGEKVPIIR